jgi:putative transposase
MRESWQAAFRIAFALNRVDAGTPPADVCTMVGISRMTFDRWKGRYSGLLPCEVSQLLRLETENRWLKKQLAHQVLETTRLRAARP